MFDLDDLVLKTVPLRFRGADLRLDLSHALFSSFDIDVGTRLLFKAIGRDEVLPQATSVLDVGSGVGVIGLAVASAFPQTKVLAQDRDLLARAFTERNRGRNKITNLRAGAALMAAGCLGGPYDFILSNVPAKAGAPVIEAFLAECARALSPEGRLGIVVVKPLVESVRSWLASAGFRVLGEERGSMHRAFVAQREHPSTEIPVGGAPLLLGGTGGTELELGGIDLSVYRRSRGDFSLLGTRYTARGYWGLPDFDTIGYGQALGTELAARSASGSLVREALVVNPGVGHAAMWIAQSLGPNRLSAASRDILSLAATGENLASLPGSRTTYRALDALRLDEIPEAFFDLHLEFAEPVPGYDWIGPLWERALRLDKRGSSFVLVVPPTEMVRVEKRRPEGFRLLGEKRKKGLSAAAWRRV